MKNQKGFTLIEVLAVVIILGILSAIAVPAISKTIEKAKHDAFRRSAQNIITAARYIHQFDNELYEDGVLTLGFLKNSDYMEKLSHPWGTVYSYASFVQVTDGTYCIYLEAGDGVGVWSKPQNWYYIGTDGSLTNTCVNESDLLNTPVTGPVNK